MQPKLFVATKALIFYKDKVLLVRESGEYADGSNPGRYDVIGGRVIPGQKFDDSLIREVREETGLEVTIGKPFHVSEWRPVVKGDNWQIIGIFFQCTAGTDDVSLSKDHDEYLWISPKEYTNYPLTDGALSALIAYNGNP